jgi:hypothetical protein
VSPAGTYAVTGRGPLARATGALRLIAAVSAVGAFGVAISLILHRYPLSVAAVFALGVGLAILALALARYDAAVALAFVLLSVNQRGLEPSDIVFAVVIAVAVFAGGLDLRRVPLTATVLVGLFLALNLFSAIESPTWAALPSSFPTRPTWASWRSGWPATRIRLDAREGSSRGGCLLGRGHAAEAAGANQHRSEMVPGAIEAFLS